MERSLCGCSFLGMFFDRGIMGFGPPKVMKNGSCSATTLPGSTALPFVISTGAQRSGEICGPSLGMFFERADPDFLLRDTSNDDPSPAEEGSSHRSEWTK